MLKLHANELCEINQGNNNRTQVCMFGNDPQIIIKKKRNGFKKGIHVLTFEEVENTDLISKNAKFYYEHNTTFSAATEITPFVKSDGNNISYEITLPCFSEVIRFDPAEKPGDFSFQKYTYCFKPISTAFASQSRGLIKYLNRRIREPNGFRRLTGQVIGILRSGGVFGLVSIAKATGDMEEDVQSHQLAYENWIKKHDYNPKFHRNKLVERITEIGEEPLISILIPTYNTNIELLDECLNSIRNQVYQNWEVCIADDYSSSELTRARLTKWGKTDSRFKVIFRNENGHISAATNTAAELACGDWYAFMDHDDKLPENALAELAIAISDNPNACMIYSDEDKLDPMGNRVGHHFKPDFNEQMLMSHNYINHFCAVKSVLFKEVGGLRLGFEGSQDHDFLLRILSRINKNQIVHIKKILYHWRAFQGSGSFSDSSLKRAVGARQRAVSDYLKSNDINANVKEGYFGRNHVTYTVSEENNKVTIIIPTKDRADLLGNLIPSLMEKSNYANLEVMIVDNGSVESKTAKLFETLCLKYDNLRVINYEQEFNYSAINNFAVTRSDGNILCFLNNDTAVINEDWLIEMVGHAIQPDTGAVGAKLLYEDNTIQHAGVVVGITGVAGHVFQGLSGEAEGYHARINVTQEYTAVTAACLVIEKSKFLSVGGFDEKNLKVAFNDVDLCLKLKDKGLVNVYTPYAKLYHFESLSRGFEDSPIKMQRFNSEIDFIQKKWKIIIKNDSNFNPNLSTSSLYFNPKI